MGEEFLEKVTLTAFEMNLHLSDRKKKKKEKVIMEAHFGGLSQSLQGHKSCCSSDNNPRPLEPLKPCVVIFSHSDWKELWWVGKGGKKGDPRHS